MWKLDYKESLSARELMLLNCDVGEDSWALLDYKDIKPVHPKGNQSWIFIGSIDDEAETPILWPPDGKSWLIGKDPDAGKDWGQEEKGRTEDEVVGWHHWLNGHEFEHALGVGDGQGILACCSPWGYKGAGHNWVTELNWLIDFGKLCFYLCWSQGYFLISSLIPLFLISSLIFSLVQ